MDCYVWFSDDRKGLCAVLNVHAPHQCTNRQVDVLLLALDSSTDCITYDLRCRLTFKSAQHVQHKSRGDNQQELSSCWDGRPFGHNRHEPKSGGLLCAFPWRELGPH